MPDNVTRLMQLEKLRSAMLGVKYEMSCAYWSSGGDDGRVETILTTLGSCARDLRSLASEFSTDTQACLPGQVEVDGRCEWPPMRTDRQRVVADE